jgi:hypothetical protein
MPPYTWSIDGLTLDSPTGWICGTPQRADEFPFTVKVTDSASNTAEKDLSITVVQDHTGLPVLQDPGDVSVTGFYILNWWPIPNAVRYELQEQFVLTEIEDKAETTADIWEMNGFERITDAAHTGDYGYWSGNTAGETQTMELKEPIVLGTDAKVSYWRRYDIEDAGATDVGAYFEIFVDDTWQTLERYHSGNSGWRNDFFDLSGYAGKSVKLGFRKKTGNYPKAGFYFDEFRLQGIEIRSDWKTISDSITETWYLIEDNTINGTYYYRVRGIDASGSPTSWSNVVDMRVNIR